MSNIESSVLVENEYYDGPRVGITLLEGVPYRFVADFEDDLGYKDTFSLFKISNHELDLEIEQWKIFIDWNNRYESGQVSSHIHPGHGGISSRWDEIELMLKSSRKNEGVPTFRATATFNNNGQEKRYDCQGPCYNAIWDISKHGAIQERIAASSNRA